MGHGMTMEAWNLHPLVNTDEHSANPPKNGVWSLNREAPPNNGLWPILPEPSMSFMRAWTFLPTHLRHPKNEAGLPGLPEALRPVHSRGTWSPGALGVSLLVPPWPAMA